jgi:hypothetical protein
MREIRRGVRLMSVPPRSPVATVLAASPKQSEALKEHIRGLLAQAWSTNPQPDLERFVLNARSRNASLRACSAGMVAQVARDMRLAFTDSGTTVAKAAAVSARILKARLAGSFDAPEQQCFADVMQARAIDQLAAIHAGAPAGPVDDGAQDEDDLDPEIDGPMYKALLETGRDAGEQANAATQLNRLAIAEYLRLQAARRPR